MWARLPGNARSNGGSAFLRGRRLQPAGRSSVGEAEDQGEAVMRTIALLLGSCGGIGCSVLGVQWLREAARYQEFPAVAALVGQDPGRLQLTAYLMLAALAAGIVGGILAYQNRGRAAAVVLLTAGVLPGILDARAFVVTCVLILAGILSLELKPETRLRLMPRSRPSQSLG